MMKSLYTFFKATAIIFVILLMTSCSSKPPQETIHIDSQRIALAEQMVMQSRLDVLAQQVYLEYPTTTALTALLDLSQDDSLSDSNQGQAALKYAEVILQLKHPESILIAAETLHVWGRHPLAINLHVALAKALILNQDMDAALPHLTMALDLAYASSEVGKGALIQDIVNTAQAVLSETSDTLHITWLLQHALVNEEHREVLLQQAAKLAPIEYVLELRHTDTPLRLEQVNFYRYAARQALMIGDYHAVRVIAKILEMDMPDTEANRVVQAWAVSEGQQNVVGVLLPLTGQYAAYGQQMLKGIRLAMSRPEFAQNITLRIQDTQGDNQVTIGAYHQLLTQNVQWVIGPLLSKNTAALLPYLVDDIPMIALSNQTQLAIDAPSLFIHNLSKSVQASFMAHYAWLSGKQRIAIIRGARGSEDDEAMAFQQRFESEGGEIVANLALEASVHDHRSALVGLLEASSNELLLASLEEELYLFSAQQNMDIKLPPNFDALYLAVSGKQLSLLAGQMAYLDMHKVQLYGSYRWLDGHLLDDGGRYLNSAQFATPITALHEPTSTVLDVQSQFRVIWAEDDMTPLFSLAYDVAMNVASLGSRLGLSGQAAIQALHEPTGFPAISGNYYFDENGISQKTFAIQRIRRGRIEAVDLQ